MAISWPEVTFGDVLLNGTRNGIYKKKEFHGSGVKIVNMGELFANPRLFSIPMKRVELTLKEKEKSCLQPGDLLFARRSLVAEGAGKCSIVIEVNEPTTFESSIIRARPDSKKMHSLFAYYLFNSPHGKYLLGTILRHVAVAGITGSDLVQLDVPLPPLPDQRAIAHILGSLDDKIELNHRMNQTLEAIVRTIFKSWFVDFDPVRAKVEGGDPSLPDDITALFPDSFEGSKVGEIPRGWTKTTLGAEVDFLTGFPFKSKYFMESPPGIRLARGMNVKEGYFYWQSQTRYWPNITSDIENYLLKSGDVLVGMDGSKVGKNWVRVRPNNLPCLLVQRVARLRKKESIGENLIWVMVGGERFRSYIDAVKTGTSIPHISGAQIKSYGFIRPPAKDNRLFEQFEAIVAPFTQKADANITESETLGQIRDILLHKLILGELRVPDAEKFVEETGL